MIHGKWTGNEFSVLVFEEVRCRVKAGLILPIMADSWPRLALGLLTKGKMGEGLHALLALVLSVLMGVVAIHEIRALLTVN